MIPRIQSLVTNLLYLVASVLLMLLSGALIVLAIWRLVEEVMKTGVIWRGLLEAIELTIVGVAVFDVSKFLVEEGAIRDGGKNYLAAARRSLTKFMTIIIVAISLDALLNIFETQQQTQEEVMYPVLLLGSAVFALIGLGVFHYLSRAAAAVKPRPEQPEE